MQINISPNPSSVSFFSGNHGKLGKTVHSEITVLLCYLEADEFCHPEDNTIAGQNSKQDKIKFKVMNI